MRADRGGGDDDSGDSVYAASERSRRASLSSDEWSSSSCDYDRCYDLSPTALTALPTCKPWPSRCDPSASERERSSVDGWLLPAYVPNSPYRATTRLSNASADALYGTPPQPLSRRSLASAAALLVVSSLASFAANAALVAWQQCRGGDQSVHDRFDAEVALEAAKNHLAQALRSENFSVSGYTLPDFYSLDCTSVANHTNCTPVAKPKRRVEVADRTFDRYRTSVGFRAPSDGTYFVYAQVTGRTLVRQPNCLQLEIAKVSPKYKGWPDVVSKARTTSQDGEPSRAGHFSLYTAIATQLNAGDQLWLRVGCVQEASCRVLVNGTASYLGLVHLSAPT